MLSEGGHYAGTFGLAKALHDRGHRIVYLGLADFEDLVKSQGFEFISFAEDLMPRGSVDRFLTSQSNPPRGIPARWKKRMEDERLFRAYLHRIENGPLDECLLKSGADVLLCDALVWYAALRAQRLGIPTINITLNLTLHANAVIPPVIFHMLPASLRMSGLCVLAAWKWMRLKFFFTKRLASVLFGAYRYPIRMHHLIDVFLRIGRRSGYRCVENQTYRYGEIAPRLMLPEIALCAEAFQLPGSPDEGRTYLGTSVDLDRNEMPLDAEIPADKPLILCSLGTNATYYPYSNRFFRSVIEAGRLRGDWSFVLHIGKHTRIPMCGEIPPNVVVGEQIPQLALLSRAAVMVHHGGTSSIRECVHFEVPMVITPGLRDQPGNAVRAVHHGLAISASMKHLDAAQLVELIDRAIHSSSIRQNLAKMKQRIAAENGMERCIEMIEKTAGSKS